MQILTGKVKVVMIRQESFQSYEYKTDLFKIYSGNYVTGEWHLKKPKVSTVVTVLKLGLQSCPGGQVSSAVSSGLASSASQQTTAYYQHDPNIRLTPQLAIDCLSHVESNRNVQRITFLKKLTDCKKLLYNEQLKPQRLFAPGLHRHLQAWRRKDAAVSKRAERPVGL